jgi:hypothetical protein
MQALEEQRRYPWYQKVTALLIAALSFEIGLFLIVFPWTEIWGNNYFPAAFPRWRWLWMSPYFRGALSGLGVVNVLVALGEVFALRRFSEPQR